MYWNLRYVCSNNLAICKYIKWGLSPICGFEIEEKVESEAVELVASDGAEIEMHISQFFSSGEQGKEGERRNWWREGGRLALRWWHFNKVVDIWYFGYWYVNNKCYILVVHILMWVVDVWYSGYWYVNYKSYFLVVDILIRVG